MYFRLKNEDCRFNIKDQAEMDEDETSADTGVLLASCLCGI